MIGIGLGLPFIKGGFIDPRIQQLVDRVASDGGTFEAQTCLQSYLNSLGQSLYNKASLIITPNAYKAAKIYALKPTNGSGDLTFSRGSARTRRNASGVLENLANNVPALHYQAGGGCPAWLFESQRTNLFLNSFAPVTQTITVVNGSTYTVSISGGSAALSGAGSGTATTGNNVTFVASGTSLTVTISGSPTWCQVELGAFATSPIVTTGASATRVGENATVTGISSLLGATEGSIFCQFRIADVINKGNNTLAIIDNGINNYMWFRKSGTNLQVLTVIGGATVSDAIISAAPFVVGVNKVAFAYRAGERVALFINGQSSLNPSNVVAAFSAFSSLGFGASTFGGAELNDSIESLAVYNTRLTNTELSALTT